jgi:hypothetical protein
VAWIKVTVILTASSQCSNDHSSFLSADLDFGPPLSYYKVAQVYQQLTALSKHALLPHACRCEEVNPPTALQSCKKLQDCRHCV